MTRILLIDDEVMMHVLFEDVTAEMGHQFAAAATLAEGRNKAAAEDYDIIFLDVLLPDGSGLDEINHFKALPSSPEVIVITSYADCSGAATVLEQGGWEYLTKPLTVEKIRQSLHDVIAYRKHKQIGRSTAIRPEGIIGTSPSLQRSLSYVEEAAQLDVTVMINGETGTGKELFARAVHMHSSRSERPFVILDCASLSPTLLVSQLFGHVRGAFTGADRSQEGVISQAHTGTLFMDEIGELPLEMQASFLRVLETGSFRPVGSRNEHESDFRLVAATNRDLEEMARQGKFRNDLLYRMRGMTISLPPLRERLDDLEPLVQYYLEKTCAELQIPAKTVNDEFWGTLTAYPWPGNVRELKHAVRGAVAAAQDSPIVFSRHLPVHVRIGAAQEGLKTIPEPQVSPAPSKAFPKLKDYRDKAEREYVEMLLDRAEHKMKTAAELAGISRGYLYELLKKHGIKR